MAAKSGATRRWSGRGSFGRLTRIVVLMIVAIGCTSEATTQTNMAGPGAIGGNAWLVRTFDSYSSTQEFLSDCASWLCNEELGTQLIFLDPSVGYEAEGLKQSMRYDFIDQGCGSVSRGRVLRLPTLAKELWIEQVMRFSRNFTSQNDACPPADWKTTLVHVNPDGNFRWDFHLSRGVFLNSPLGDNAAIGGDPLVFVFCGVSEFQYFDEQWHVVRIHFRHSTTASSRDGVMEAWIDGQYLCGRNDINTNEGTAMDWIVLGANKDKGQNQGTESLWIGRVSVFNEDPGW